jgi:S1-C subfamily serine protease
VRRGLRIGVIGLLLLALVANAGLLVGVVLTREPAPKPLTGQRIQTASRPAIVLIQSNYTVSASIPQPVVTDATVQQIYNQLLPRIYSGEITSQAALDQAIIEAVLANPDAYISVGKSVAYSFPMGATGSGFFVTEDGYLVTAAHVVSANKDEIHSEVIAETNDPQFIADTRNTITQQWANYSPTDAQITGLVAFYQKWLQKYLTVDKVDAKYYLGTGTVVTGDQLVATGTRASVVSIDPTATGHDIAIMKADVSGVPTLQLSTASPHFGQATYAIGYPRKAYLQESVPLVQTVPATMTSGQVLLVDQRPTGWTAWGTSATFTPGDSGGPVLGPDGTVAGLISYHQTDATGQQALGSGFFVPSQYIAADLASQSITVTAGPKSLTATYYHALAEGDVQRYKTELLLLEDIQARSPFDAYVKDDITSTQSQILGGNDKTPPDLTAYVPAAAASGGGVALLAIVVWIGMGMVGRRRRPVAVAEVVAEPPAETVRSDAAPESEPIAESAAPEEAQPAQTEAPAT